MLITILAVFCVCWLPCQVMLLYTELRGNRSKLGDWYYKFEFAAYTMAYSNSALNPLIYAGFNENFKQGFEHYRIEHRDTQRSKTTRSTEHLATHNR
ncbi:galanin receptor 2b-like isoform X2 [Saccostrea cucullata]|uniref:galanin receptor 2b-like isoform X2 n=1 Tax=Saccostrea cuccullata TaxID=36930 RepID=UPI002ED5080F